MNTTKVLTLLADGEPRTFKQIVAATGLAESQLHVALGHIRRRGYATAAPIQYAVTESGVARLLVVPITPAEKAARRIEARRLKHAAAAEALRLAEEAKREKKAQRERRALAARMAKKKPMVEPVAPAFDTASLVASAKANRPALDCAWMRSPETVSPRGAREGAGA